MIKNIKNETNGSRGGFSLLEIIISLAIFIALAAGIFSTVSFAKRVSLQANQKSVAVAYLESRLSELKSLGSRLDETKDVDDPLAVNDINLIRSADCSQIEGGKQTPYCVAINEYNGHMTGLVMAKVRDDPSAAGFKQVLVVSKWVDFTLPGKVRVRTEAAVTGVNPE